MTAVANTAFTAAQFNQYVRDNLNETAPAKATGANQIFVSTGANAIAARTPSSHFVGANETTTSTTYTDLTTTGPTIAVGTGTRAIVIMNTQIWASGNATAWASYAVTGASSISGSDSRGVSTRVVTGGDANAGPRISAVQLEAGLTAGTNTFTMQYRTTANTARYDNRHIVIFPL